MFLCSLRCCLKCYFSKGVYSFTLSTVYIYIYIYIYMYTQLTYCQILTKYTLCTSLPYITKDKDRKYKLYKLFTIKVYSIQLKIKIKNTNYANASLKYCTCAERNIVSQAASWGTVGLQDDL